MSLARSRRNSFGSTAITCGAPARGDADGEQADRPAPQDGHGVRAHLRAAAGAERRCARRCRTGRGSTRPRRRCAGPPPIGSGPGPPGTRRTPRRRRPRGSACSGRCAPGRSGRARSGRRTGGPRRRRTCRARGGGPRSRRPRRAGHLVTEGQRQGCTRPGPRVPLEDVQVRPADRRRLHLDRPPGRGGDRNLLSSPRDRARPSAAPASSSACSRARTCTSAAQASSLREHGLSMLRRM